MGQRDERFLCDLMLGKLAVYLRMCGFDTVYAGDFEADHDAALHERAMVENRRLLSRDRSLIERTPDSLYVGSHEIEAQLNELRTAGISLALPDRPLRCGRCNGPLEDDPAEPTPEYVPDDRPAYRCCACGQLFWRGSHWDRVATKLSRSRD